MSCGILGMASDVSDFKELLTSILNSSGSTDMESTPRRKRQASQRAQELETDLSDGQLVKLLQVFEESADAADAYLSINREGVRKLWVQDRIGDLF